MTRPSSHITRQVRRDLAAILRGIDTELHRIGNDMERDVVNYIESNRLEIEGDLKKGINFQVDYAGGSFTLRFGGSAIHTYFVEEGRRAGKFPPVDAMRRWVYRKLNITGKERERVAFLVGRKIKRKGTKAHRMIHATWRDHQASLQGRIDSAVSRQLAGAG